MATHSSHFTWEIPWTEESGGLQSMRSQRVGHDRVAEHACKKEHRALWEEQERHTETTTVPGPLSPFRTLGCLWGDLNSYSLCHSVAKSPIFPLSSYCYLTMTSYLPRKKKYRMSVMRQMQGGQLEKRMIIISIHSSFDDPEAVKMVKMTLITKYIHAYCIISLSSLF